MPGDAMHFFQCANAAIGFTGSMLREVLVLGFSPHMS